MTHRDTDMRDLLSRLLVAVNQHHLGHLVACFADDYLNETPAHPHRGFRGQGQVRQNWTRIFSSVPDLRADVPRVAIHGDTLWTEWDMAGTRSDGDGFHLRGVIIFRVSGQLISSARFYLEPVEHLSGDAPTAVSQLLGTTPSSQQKGTS